MNRGWLAIPMAAAVAAAATVATTATGQQPAQPTSAPSITVNGSASVPSGSTNAADEQSSYQAALGQALTDAKTKALFIAAQEGVTLAGVEDVTENSDSPTGTCGPVPFSAVAGGVATPSVAPGVARHKAKAKPKPKAKAKPGRGAAARASAAQATEIVDCGIDAQVTVTYYIGPAAATTTSSTTSTATTTSSPTPTTSSTTTTNTT